MNNKMARTGCSVMAASSSTKTGLQPQQNDGNSVNCAPPPRTLDAATVHVHERACDHFRRQLCQQVPTGPDKPKHRWLGQAANLRPYFIRHLSTVTLLQVASPDAVD